MLPTPEEAAERLPVQRTVVEGKSMSRLFGLINDALDARKDATRGCDVFVTTQDEWVVEKVLVLLAEKGWNAWYANRYITIYPPTREEERWWCWC
jgi:hypothetical protein